MDGCRTFITVDVDWASDEYCAEIHEKLLAGNVPATWFVTHDFDFLSQLRDSPELVELGIHPNFYADSSQGGSVPVVLNNLLSLIPEAVSSRSHGAFQNGSILEQLVGTGQIKIDSSLFLDRHSKLYPTDHMTRQGLLKRIPIFWADDHEILFRQRRPLALDRQGNDGCRVFLFHPVYLAESSPRFDGAIRDLFEQLLERARHTSGEEFLRIKDVLDYPE